MLEMVDDEDVPQAQANNIPQHVHHVIGPLHLEVRRGTQPDSTFKYFSIDSIPAYVAFCDDFGPMNLGAVHTFCTIVDSFHLQWPNTQIALRTRDDPRSMTNAVFLLGSYMMMKHDAPVDRVEQCFHPLQRHLLSFRDVSPGIQNFHLYLRDCWAGLHKAKQLGWVDFGPDGFQAEEYEHYDNPLNADMHEVVPGKFVAMRGPQDLPDDAEWRDVHDESGHFSHREFSPKHFVFILSQFNVQAVVRLNKPRYSQDHLVEAGIAVADLFFEDCTTPPPDVVAKFMVLAESLPGAVAVHCRAGLGRTGTLIALYMMKHYDFSAREAMGWLRIVRPGSVIGAQQQFLCDKEEAARGAGERFRREGRQAKPVNGVSAVQALVRDISVKVEQRLTYPGGTNSQVAPTAVKCKVAEEVKPLGPSALASIPLGGSRAQWRRPGSWSEAKVLGEIVSGASNRRIARRAHSSLGLERDLSETSLTAE